MRRPAVRLLLTLAISACAVGSVPATTEAGIIPWAYDAVFGPVGSLQGRSVAYGANYGGCATGCGVAYYQGPAPVLFGGRRARRLGYAAYGGVAYGGFGGGCGTCSTGCGYASPLCGSCGTSCGGACGVGGCSTGDCGVSGYSGSNYLFDGGYGVSNCASGGCATGQCNVNYGPTGSTVNNGVNSAASPVTPAVRPPVTGDSNSVPKTNGPTQYDNQSPARSGTNDGYQLPVGPGEGFRPRGSQEAAPTSGDPAPDGFVPPKVNSTNKPDVPADASPSDTTNGAVVPTEPATPPVTPIPKAPKRNFGEEDEEKKGSSIGPRLELQEKITWRRNVQRSRQDLSAVRVSATVNRSALFPKMAWKITSDSELAKK